MTIRNASLVALIAATTLTAAVPVFAKTETYVDPQAGTHVSAPVVTPTPAAQPSNTSGGNGGVVNYNYNVYYTPDGKAHTAHKHSKNHSRRTGHTVAAGHHRAHHARTTATPANGNGGVHMDQHTMRLLIAAGFWTLVILLGIGLLVWIVNAILRGRANAATAAARNGARGRSASGGGVNLRKTNGDKNFRSIRESWGLDPDGNGFYGQDETSTHEAGAAVCYDRYHNP